MKKLSVAAVLCGSVFSACASDITVYGLLDQSLTYDHYVLDGYQEGNGSQDLFSMGALYSDSYFGIKGEESLGAGWFVSFVLESGFGPDDGSLYYSGRMFGRESRLSIHGPYGTVSFGRMGALSASTGSSSILRSTADVFGGRWHSYALGTYNWVGDRYRFDNMVEYRTPTAAGFTGYAQYSFGTDGVNGYDDGVSNGRDTERYAGVGLTYVNGPVQAVVVYDVVMPDHRTEIGRTGDSRVLSIGGSYDFTTVKVFAAGQYVKGQKNGTLFGNAMPLLGYVDGQVVTAFDADGYNLHLGAAVPAGNGVFKLAGYLGRMEINQGDDAALDSFCVAATYEYFLSKRTSLYGAVGFMQVKQDEDDVEKEASFKFTTVGLGLTHKF